MKSAITRAICIHFTDTHKPYYKNGKVLRLLLRKECWTRGSPAREDATTIHGRLLLNRGDYSKQFPRLFSRPWDSSSSTPSALSSGVNQQKEKEKKKTGKNPIDRTYSAFKQNITFHGSFAPLLSPGGMACRQATNWTQLTGRCPVIAAMQREKRAELCSHTGDSFSGRVPPFYNTPPPHTHTLPSTHLPSQAWLGVYDQNFINFLFIVQPMSTNIPYFLVGCGCSSGSGMKRKWEG